MRRSPDGALSATRQRCLKRPISPSLQRPLRRSRASSVRSARAERAPQSCSLRAWPQRSTAKTRPSHKRCSRRRVRICCASWVRIASGCLFQDSASMPASLTRRHQLDNSPSFHSLAGSPLRSSTGRTRAALGSHISFRSAMPPMSISVMCSITSPATRQPAPSFSTSNRSAELANSCRPPERPRATSRCSWSRPDAWRKARAPLPRTPVRSRDRTRCTTPRSGALACCAWTPCSSCSMQSKRSAARDLLPAIASRS